jgi:citrate synthase
MTSLVAPKGLEGVVVDRTAISTTDSSGNLLYRGYRVIDLVDKLDFESVAHLILTGKIPDTEAKSRFSDLLKSNSLIEGRVREIIRVLKEPNIMNNLRSIVSLYPYRNRKNMDLLIEIASKFPAIIYYSDVAIRGWRDMEEIGGTYAERLYKILTGTNDRENSKFFEKLLIMYMEHEFNSSTFALRVTASTLADPVCGITSALSALKGPLHGGANSEVLDYLLKFKSEDEAIKFI